MLVITVNLLAFGWGGIYLWRKSYPGRLYAHALALGQSLLIAQVALGLLLLSDGRRAPDKLHYAYGTFALLAALSPWLYAPPVPARRLAVVRGSYPPGDGAFDPRVHHGMSRINPTVRGFAIILLIAVGIWLLQLQTALFSLLLLARIAFFLAIAFFLFLLWRERRGEIAMWSASSRAVFYGAVGLAVVNVGAAILAPYPSGSLEVLVFIFVLAACGYSLWRVWRREHTYGY